MKVQISLLDFEEANKVRAPLAEFARQLENTAGLEGVVIGVRPGVMQVMGYDQRGQRAETAIGFATLREYTFRGPTGMAALAAYLVQRLRTKMGYPTQAELRRQVVGTMYIPLLGQTRGDLRNFY